PVAGAASEAPQNGWRAARATGVFQVNDPERLRLGPPRLVVAVAVVAGAGSSSGCEKRCWGSRGDRPGGGDGGGHGGRACPAGYLLPGPAVSQRLCPPPS